MNCNLFPPELPKENSTVIQLYGDQEDHPYYNNKSYPGYREMLLMAEITNSENPFLYLHLDVGMRPKQAMAVVLRAHQHLEVYQLERALQEFTIIEGITIQEFWKGMGSISSTDWLWQLDPATWYMKHLKAWIFSADEPDPDLMEVVQRLRDNNLPVPKETKRYRLWRRRL